MRTVLNDGSRQVRLTPKEEEQLAKIREPRDEAMRVYGERWKLLFEQAMERQRIGQALDAVGIATE